MTTGQKSETESAVPSPLKPDDESNKRKQEDGMLIWYLVSTLRVVLQLLMSNGWLTIDY